MYDPIEAIKFAIGTGMVGASGYTIVNEIHRIIKDMHREKVESFELTDWQIAPGYNLVNGYKNPIIFDFKKTPHMLVSGLSQQGKSKMVEGALRDKPVILVNTFRADFTKLNNVIERVNDTKEIERIFEFLLNVKEGQNTTPIFIVIDELLSLVLSGDKNIMNLLTRLLALGAHNNIYIVAISQSSEKEIIKNKNLFNIRVCFKMVEDSSYKVVLGYTPEDNQLQPRQFHFYSDRVGTAFTYDV